MEHMSERNFSLIGHEEDDKEFIENRIHFLFISGWIGVFASLVMSVIEIFRNEFFRVIPSLLFSVVAPILLLALHRDKNHYQKTLTGLAALILLQQILGAFLAFNEVLMVIWYPVFPLTYFFLLGYRRAIFWNLAALSAITVGYIVFPFLNSRPPVSFPVFISAFLAYSVSTALAWYHYRVIHTYQLRLKHEALFDPLTGALLRKAGLARLETLIARNSRSPQPMLSVALFDIDNFKKLNDRDGHQEGDRILSTLSATVRKMVSHEELFVRLGGEEFLLVFPDCPLKELPSRIDAIRTAISEYVEGKDGTPVTVSIGLTRYRSGENISSLLHRADNLMYQAKKQGRNNLQWSREEFPAVPGLFPEFSPS